MNLGALASAERVLLDAYPLGLQDPFLQTVAKKHAIDLRHQQARAWFAKENFALPLKVAGDWVTLVSRSSLVSRFEKPHLKRGVDSMTVEEREYLAHALFNALHEDRERGFSELCAILQTIGSAKWSVTTVAQYYYSPRRQVFVKPTTTKAILRFYGLTDLTYQSSPTFDFYENYRTAILSMRDQFSPELQGDNAAFTGLLLEASKRLTMLEGR